MSEIQQPDLRALRTQRLRADFLRERIECIRADLERITALPRNGTGGGAGDKMSGPVAKLIDLQQQYAEEVVEIESSLQITELTLSQLPDKQQTILRLRYIEGLTWENVARRTHYDPSHCRRIHRVAMKYIKNEHK